MTREEILQKAIDTYGVSAQEDMMLEEMSELTKAILKLRRASYADKNGWLGDGLKSHINEEIADVQIMLDQMRMIYGGTSEQEAYKLERLEKRLEDAK